MVLKFIVSCCFFLTGALSHAQTVKEIYFSVTVDPCALNSTIQSVPVTDHAILKLPASYTSEGKPTRLIYMAHGAGGGVSENSWFLNQFELQKVLLDNGYAVFDVNGGRVENMGGEFVVASAYKAWQHIVENYNVHPQIIVGGFSMGGLSSTNFVYQHSALVLGHVMYSPVLDLYEQAWKNPWLGSTRKAIAEVYSFSDITAEEFDQCAAAASNPIERNIFKTGTRQSKLYPVPVKIWHGTGDKIVTVPASRRFSELIRSGGGTCELVEIDSDDHGLSCGNAVMNQELLAYIRRFN